ncbi:MAG: hypothetical protein ACFFC7_24570 [Candidatus Hermodarchaeota archaeon]
MTKPQGSRSQWKSCLIIESLQRTLKKCTAHSKRQPTQSANLIIPSSEGVTLKAQNKIWVYLSDE